MWGATCDVEIGGCARSLPAADACKVLDASGSPADVGFAVKVMPGSAAATVFCRSPAGSVTIGARFLLTEKKSISELGTSGACQAAAIVYKCCILVLM